MSLKLMAASDATYLPSSGGEVIPEGLASDGGVD